MLISSNNDKISHALLFSGGIFEHKKTYALQIAKKLLCEHQTLCEKCQGCLWVEKTSHPDLLILPQELTGTKNDIKNTIKIDDIRLATSHLSQTSHQGKCKIVLLLKTDSMSMGAMNALLKTLEEPPPHSYVFLLSEYPHLLPATILSRCQKISFPIAKKSSDELISLLINTLKSLKKNLISPFEAAEKWQKHPLIDILDGLYYCLLESKAWGKNLFLWQDKLNRLRRQVLNKQNPNHLLALEQLFYQWTIAGIIASPVSIERVKNVS